MLNRQSLAGTNLELTGLEEYCVTVKEKAIIDAVTIAGMTRKDAATHLGMTRNAVQKGIARIRKRAALRGFSPSHDMVHTTPETHLVKGTSTLYKEGRQVLQWVKTDKSREDEIEVMKEIVEAMKEGLEPVERIPLPSSSWYITDIIPWLIISDAHIGMLSRQEEVGHDFDLKKAELELCSAIRLMIETMPRYERIVINDLGDFTHFENFAGVTAASGHPLDVACSFQAMIKLATRIMRFIVETCLNKFKFVDLIVNQGNHSRVNDIWMAELFTHLYEDNPRLTVINNGNIFIPYRMGNTFVMTHHGDKCKADKLAHVMTNDYSEDFGESHYRYVFTGHVHHKQVTKENAGITVESFSNLTPADRYSHDNGYRSGSCLTVVELSKKYGEVGRRIIPIERIQDIISDLNGKNETFMDNKRKNVYTVS
jgi:hypothetical protein